MSANKRYPLLLQGFAVSFSLCLLIICGAAIVGCFKRVPNTGVLGAPLSVVGTGALRVSVGPVTPNSSLDVAGIKSGALLSFDRPVDLVRRKNAGDLVGVNVIGPHGLTHAVLVTQEAPDVSGNWRIRRAVLIDLISSMGSAVIGFLILVRARLSRTLLALGMSLVCLGYAGYALPINWDSQTSWPIVTKAIDLLRWKAVAVSLLYFSIGYFEDNLGTAPVRMKRLIRGFLSIFGITTTIVVVSMLSGYTLPLVNLDSIFYISAWSDAAAGIAILTSLWWGWYCSKGDLRQRYALLFCAFSIMLGGQVCGVFSDFDTNLFLFGEGLFIAFCLLFPYAVLRHKVINLDFVLSRAIVYGVVSAILLVAFGIIEWLSEHLVHFEGREKSVLLDGAIALVTYLAFHKVRHVAEHRIEQFFFRSWHANEAKLRRFVHEANFISSQDTLIATLRSALERFTGGSAVNVFLRASNNRFENHSGATSGGVPDVLDGDDGLALALQADGTTVVLDDVKSVLPGALAAPLINRGKLLGLVLLGPKPAGAAFRPDEINLIGWAVHLVGLDYQALMVEQLEQRAGSLEQGIAVRDVETVILRDQVDSLREAVRSFAAVNPTLAT